MTQTIKTPQTGRMRILLKKFHGLQKMRLVLNSEIERTRQEILFQESFSGGDK